MYDCGQTGEDAVVWALLIRMAFVWLERASIMARGVPLEGLLDIDRL
jgi:hypothetical protein